MTFNRGNRIIKTKIMSNKTPLDDVKSMKYLGFTISANQSSFAPTLVDLSIKANRAIFALNNTIKLSTLPTKLASKVFYSQISPILLLWLGSLGSLRTKSTRTGISWFIKSISLFLQYHIYT